jgi:hypothetical protein
LGGSRVIAVSASNARFCIQFFGFECKLYFRPFWSSAVSPLEKLMFVLFMSLGWKVCGLCGVFVSIFARRSSFRSSALYFVLASLPSSSSIVVCM